MIAKKSESKYVSAMPKILNGPSLLTWRSVMSSIIFCPFRLLGNAHLFNLLFRWPVGGADHVDLRFEFDNGYVKEI